MNQDSQFNSVFGSNAETNTSIQEELVTLRRQVAQLEQELRRLNSSSQAGCSNLADYSRIEKNLFLFSRAVESTPHAIAFSDITGNLFYMNPAFSKMYECETVEEFMQNGGIKAVFADPVVATKVMQTISAGETWIGETEQISCRGKRFQVMEQANPIKDDAGNIVALMAVLTDISSEKAAKHALKTSQQELLALLNAMEDVILVMDSEGRYLKIAPSGAPLLYKPSEKILGKTLHEVLSTEVADFFLNHIQQAILTQQTVKIEYSLPIGAKEVWFDGSIAPLGKTLVVLVARDITERKLAQQILQKQVQREQLLNRLTSQIRQSLDFDVIVSSAVKEIQEFLQIDRCSFFWYRYAVEEPYWENICESCLPGLANLTGCYPAYILGDLTDKLLNNEVFSFDDIEECNNLAYRQMLQNLGFKSMLNIPMETNLGIVGGFSCIQQQSKRSWKHEEIELLKAVIVQLSIAFHQTELYKQAQIKAQELEQTLQELQRTQAQMIQNEKMSSLGQIVAGVAHEINNPINFIYANISHAHTYTQELIDLIQVYRKHYPKPVPEVKDKTKRIDLEFIQEDLNIIFKSMSAGSERIEQIVKSLRTFSRLDEAEYKNINIHESLDSTLMILQHRLKAKPNYPKIEVTKEYGQLPLVGCYAGQLNQVFMNILVNAIDALEEKGHNKFNQIRIYTEFIESEKIVAIKINNNGNCIPNQIQHRIFDPFFTTKPVGKGTGLGMSISYEIITKKHQGTLEFTSTPEDGTCFIIRIPIKQ
jgi:PAS domain S-box-containing protein